jgi:hypothetical protein
MRHIDLGINKPNDEWLAESDRLTNDLIALHEAGDIAGRNQLIKENAKHWGALKRWLLEQSHNKCWFSEAREIYSHMDVEHFRPKTEAKDLQGTARDGYWWLAFDYRNFRVCGNVGNRKKGGFFPLQEGSLVSTYGNRCEESEIPYLLDPTDVEDVGLLAFDEEGKAIATPGVSDWEELRVEETIKRLKFNEHEALTEARRRVWQRVSLEIALYHEAKGRCLRGGNPAAKMKATGHLRNIMEMTRKDAELSSVARWCVHFKNDPKLSKLVA